MEGIVILIVLIIAPALEGWNQAAAAAAVIWGDDSRERTVGPPPLTVTAIAHLATPSRR